MDSDVDFTLVSTLHAEGRHIQAEWERLKGNKAREDAMEDELASHRLSFFLGAVAVWQALQEADDDEAVVEEIQEELETFLAATEAEGRISLSDRDRSNNRTGPGTSLIDIAFVHGSCAWTASSTCDSESGHARCTISARQHQWTGVVMDDPKIRGPQDRSRINTEQDYEVRYWTQELGVSEEQLRQAVQRVGSSADKVREHLRQSR